MGNLTDALAAIQGGLTDKTAATFASTDLVTIYDPTTNEPSGKISRADLMAAVKASLPGLMSDQGTSIASLPSINGSGELGKITSANLASVLGALCYKESLSSVDLNDYVTTGIYKVTQTNSSTITNTPVTGVGYTLEVILSEGFVVQRATRQETNVVYTRTKPNGGSWQNWTLNYDSNLLSNSTELANIVTALSGASNLSTLATALGAITVSETVLNSSDMIDANNAATGFFCYNTIEAETYHVKYEYGFLLTLKVGDIERRVQLNLQGGKAALRSQWANSWTEWKEFTVS